jgi:hypothetical protein
MTRAITPSITRRIFLQMVGWSSAAAVSRTATQDVQASDVDPTTIDERSTVESVTGYIKAVHKAHVLLETGSGILVVRPTTTARMYSGIFGTIKSVDRFIVGDWVAAEGQRRGADFTATTIGTIYAPKTLEVLAVDEPQQLVTTNQGSFDTSKQWLPDVGDADRIRISDIGPGSKIYSAICWRHPTTGRAYLVAGRVSP